MNSGAWRSYGAPGLTHPATRTRIQLTVSVLNKTSTRLPESLWVRYEHYLAQSRLMRLSTEVATRAHSRFSPVVASNGQGWMMEKLGAAVDPSDVVVNGSRVSR